MVEDSSEHGEATGKNDGDMEGGEQKKLLEVLAEECRAEDDQDDNARPEPSPAAIAR